MNTELITLAKAWIKANHKTLKKYKGEWIAYNGVDGIIAHDKEVSKVVASAEASEKFHILKYLHPYTYSGLRRIV